MITLQNLSYIHPNKDLLFDHIHLSVQRHDKIALVGNNGTGKSTLMKIITGELQASAGQLTIDATPYYIPQLFGQYNHLTLAEAWRVEHKRKALREILSGHASEANFTLLDDDWTIEERCYQALEQWQLTGLDWDQPLGTLSGGQKTKVFLAGISIHQPRLILMDEPSNHLDLEGRRLLYDFIQSTSASLLIISHDRQLLNLLNKVYELDERGITTYGGNYDFYKKQKETAFQALDQEVKSKEKALKKAKEKERETLERQRKLDARGKKKQEKAGIPTIMMNTLRNRAEGSTAKLKGQHSEKINHLSKELQELRTGRPDIGVMKLDFDPSNLHRGKILYKATGIQISYGKQPLWKNKLTFQINSGERIALKGANGSGKTTFIKIILGKLEPEIGHLYRADTRYVYMDQDYSLLDNTLSVYQQAQKVNTTNLQEHELKTRLTRFLLTQKDWDKPCHALSGGERMRLMLCCLMIRNQAPDVWVLDEPTNNLDIHNIEILTTALQEYEGTLIIVSHDESFLKETRIDRVIQLS